MKLCLISNNLLLAGLKKGGSVGEKKKENKNVKRRREGKEREREGERERERERERRNRNYRKSVLWVTGRQRIGWDGNSTPPQAMRNASINASYFIIYHLIKGR